MLDKQGTCIRVELNAEQNPKFSGIGKKIKEKHF